MALRDIFNRWTRNAPRSAEELHQQITEIDPRRTAEIKAQEPINPELAHELQQTLVNYNVDKLVQKNASHSKDSDNTQEMARLAAIKQLGKAQMMIRLQEKTVDGQVITPAFKDLKTLLVAISSEKSLDQPMWEDVLTYYKLSRIKNVTKLMKHFAPAEK